MKETSQLLPLKESADDRTGYHSPVLFKESSTSRLYRISKAGKHFIIKTPKDDSERLVSLLRREYGISITLSHPYLVNVFTFEEDTPAGSGIVMEYVDGRNLREFLLENPSGKLRERVVDQLLDVVGYLHCKGIIHNDLKPENILITRVNDSVKLIDFGLSDNDAYYLSKSQGCTPRYASPELLRQESLDSRSDIYSIGLLIREILGSGAGRIVRKCTASDRKDRYANIAQVRKALAVRSYPSYLFFVLVVVLAAAVLGSRFQGRLSEFQDYQETERLKQEMCDSVYDAIDARMREIYTDLERRLTDIPYMEFAFLELSKSMEQLPQICDSFENVTSDRTLIHSFVSYYALAQNRYYEKMVEIIQAKPSMSDSGLPADEQLFYSTLISREESYRPSVK